MDRKEREKIFHELPLFAGGDLDEATSDRIQKAIEDDAELGEEARRYEHALEDLAALRDCRPESDESDEAEADRAWEAIQSRLLSEAGRSSRRDPLWRSPSLRVASVAALLLIAFGFGFSMRDLGLLPATSGTGGGVAESGTEPATDFGTEGLADLGSEGLGTPGSPAVATPVNTENPLEGLQEVPEGVRLPGAGLLRRVVQEYDF